MSKFNIGEKATAKSVNSIQETLDEIVSLWDLSKAGNEIAEKDKPLRAMLVNHWISWLKKYASQIDCTELTDVLNNIKANEKIKADILNEIHSSACEVQNYCNRSECNDSECNDSECNDSECNDDECNDNECCDNESNDDECCRGECSDGECNTGECSDSECSDSECNSGECSDGECSDGECCDGED